MKKQMKLLAVAALIAAPLAQAQPKVNVASVKKVVDEIGGPEEAKKMFQQAQRGVNDAKREVSRVQGEINTIRKECPAEAFNPFGGKFKMSCAQKSALLAKKELELAAKKAKELWESELAQKIRALIQKNYPAVKKQLGL